jgi:hypothetical protein
MNPLPTEREKTALGIVLQCAVERLTKAHVANSKLEDRFVHLAFLNIRFDLGQKPIGSKKVFDPSLQPAQPKFRNSEIEQDLPAVEIITPVSRSRPLGRACFQLSQLAG